MAQHLALIFRDEIRRALDDAERESARNGTAPEDTLIAVHISQCSLEQALRIPTTPYPTGRSEATDYRGLRLVTTLATLRALTPSPE